VNNIIITFEDGSKKEYRRGIKLEEVINDIQPEEQIICASFGNTIISYEDTLNRNDTLYRNNNKCICTIIIIIK